MKIRTALTFALVVSFTISGPPPLRAAAYTEAQFTRVDNDVRILKENAQPASATVGAQIKAVTSVATGANSRAELRFPDKSLTRLGANTRFTLRGEGRTLDLNQGVIMLQVPKMMGGAKVRTAAVTAAVTGTTVMIEYLPEGFVKLIVIEGEVDLFNNSNPSDVQKATAGQMILMKPDGKNPVPVPVDIDLKKLLQTSQLLSADDNGPNNKQINNAIQGQQQELKTGELSQTGLVIPGKGNIITLTNEARLNIFQNFGIRDASPPPAGSPPPNGQQPSGNNAANQPGTTQPGATQPGGGSPGGAAGTNPPLIIPPSVAQLDRIPGTSAIRGDSVIHTDPTVEAFNQEANAIITSNGKLYNGLRDGVFSAYAFGNAKSFSLASGLQPLLNSRGESGAFRFQELEITGTPVIHTSDPPAHTLTIPHLILAAEQTIKLYDPNPPVSSYSIPDGGGIDDTPPVNDPPVNDPPTTFSTFNTNIYTPTDSLDLTATALKSITLWTDIGNLELQSGFSIYGINQDLTMVAAGAAGDININGNIDLQLDTETPTTADLFISSGHNVNIGATATVSAGTINANALNDISVAGGAKITSQKSTTLTATNNITISSSAALKVLANDPNALLRIASLQGNIIMNGANLVSGFDSGRNEVISSIGNIQIEAFQGNIDITDSILQSGRDIDIAANFGHVTITGGEFTAGDVFRAGALDANGLLTINGGANGIFINAANLIRLYGGDANGVLFTGIVNLNTSMYGQVDISGGKVRVETNGVVNIPNGNIRIFAKDDLSHDYDLNDSTNAATRGRINGNVNKINGFGGRPVFRDPLPPVTY
jgi:hypothetical protein